MILIISVALEIILLSWHRSRFLTMSSQILSKSNFHPQVHTSQLLGDTLRHLQLVQCSINSLRTKYVRYIGETLGIYSTVFYKCITMEELQLKFSCSVYNTEN